MATRDSGTWCGGAGDAVDTAYFVVESGCAPTRHEQPTPRPPSGNTPSDTIEGRALAHAFCGTVLVANITNHSLLFTVCKGSTPDDGTGGAWACTLMRTLHERLLPVVVAGAGNVNVTRDGVTAAYADTVTDTAALRAMRDALELHARAAALLAPGRDDRVIPPGTGLRIAIVTGDMHLVPIEPPLAHASHPGGIAPFIMGDTVSLATRLCASSFLRPDRLALCDATYRALQVEPGLSSLQFTHRTWRPTPGTAYPIHLFECPRLGTSAEHPIKPSPPTRAGGTRQKAPRHGRVPSARS